jgi:hypothetical protein
VEPLAEPPKIPEADAKAKLAFALGAAFLFHCTRSFLCWLMTATGLE